MVKGREKVGVVWGGVSPRGGTESRVLLYNPES